MYRLIQKPTFHEMLLVLGDSKRNMHNIILWLLKINNYVNNLGLMSKERLINLDHNSRSPKTIRVCSSLVEHTFRNHRYTSHAVPLSTPASLAASVTGYWRAHQYISRNHCWSVRRELLKKLSSPSFFSLCTFYTTNLRHQRHQVWAFQSLVILHT